MKQNEIAELLPEVFRRAVRRGEPVAAILDVMERLHQPDEHILSSLDALFNPRLTRDSMVVFLAHWVNLQWLLTEEQNFGGAADGSTSINGLGRLRELIAKAAHLSQWRGTRHGLQSFISIALGIEQVHIDDNPVDKAGKEIPFHMVIKVSEDAHPYESVLRNIIEHEKPAHITYELRFQQ